MKNKKSPHLDDAGEANRRNKDKHFRAQTKRVFAAFHSQPKTMLMVSVETGILRANICRYVAKLRQYDNIQLIRKGICPISKHRAGFYQIKKEVQLWKQ